MKHIMTHRLPGRCIRNASRTVDGIKLRLLECVEGDVAETKDAMHLFPLILPQKLLLRKLKVKGEAFKENLHGC